MKIATFNVLRLGWEKVNKEGVRDIIIKIMSQYSVVLLVEVMDKTGGDAMGLLLQHLNEYVDNTNNPYRKLGSELLGPKGHKEKFVYFYRKNEVEIIRCYQYVDNDEDVITRQPFIVRLNCQNTVVQDLVLIPVHIKPKNAEAELNALHDVVEVVRKRLQNDNIMILGDFNADGPYLSKKKKKTLRIFLAPYHLLIGDDVDTTTTKKKKSTYDRIVVYGKRMLEAIVPNSAIAYNFDREWNLEDKQTKSVNVGWAPFIGLPTSTIAGCSQIVSEYSVVVLLEVMDESGKAMKLLLKHLNDYGDNRSNPYRKLGSEPLGSGRHKEKFVYFYRENEVQILDSYQYLAREPFAVLLKCPNTVVQNLVLIPVHTKPSDAEAELNALHDVVEDVRERWQNDNIMILGDFNADGPYLSKSKKDSILISSAPYYWLIDDDVDTTTSNNNDHTYDRIVVYGERMLKAIVPNSAIAYNFEEDLNLTEEETQSVSDHYPVEVELKQKAARKRNPGTTGGAQKKKPGPAAKKRRGA
ncbi:hypothetical protein JOQ06_014391 [Pogonophryne albipinna]|uniref:Endonuclease/exonuclease/phosphatase domain-containing protein n=1 Tax=Pogonophryne albipinna TaxID=1090488 RepID=A0AAD6AL32_9TELE|nr:hypothetical protein JOQ06_014391 [Pogonophryne albipinna]